MRSLLVAAALFALPLVLPTLARADAIPPAPNDCPRGKVGVSSHSGAQCIEDAPKDCPRGWTGRLGGVCALTPCTTDASCQTGEECAPHAVCLQPQEDDTYDYGEDEREEHGELEPTRLLASPNLLAGPPMPRKKRPSPIFRYDAMNLCSADVACLSPRTCQTEKLCVPKGARATAYRGTNIAGARVARKTPAVLTTSSAPASEATAPPSVKGGCAGCAATSEAPSSRGGVVALSLSVALLLARRRAKRPFFAARRPM